MVICNLTLIQLVNIKVMDQADSEKCSTSDTIIKRSITQHQLETKIQDSSSLNGYNTKHLQLEHWKPVKPMNNMFNKLN